MDDLNKFYPDLKPDVLKTDQSTTGRFGELKNWCSHPTCQPLWLLNKGFDHLNRELYLKSRKTRYSESKWNVLIGIIWQPNEKAFKLLLSLPNSFFFQIVNDSGQIDFFAIKMRNIKVFKEHWKQKCSKKREKTLKTETPRNCDLIRLKQLSLLSYL